MTYDLPRPIYSVFIRTVVFLLICVTSTSLSAQVEITGAASCDNGVGDTAMPNQYFVEVSDVTNDSAATVTSFQVTIAGDTQTFTAGGPSIFFGPFDHSGAGGAVQTVIASDDTNTGAQSTGEVPELLCGVTPDGGQASGAFCTPSSDPEVPTGSILAQSAPGTFMAGGTSGQVQTYVLVDDMGFIVQSNATGLFTELNSGNYTVYAVNFREDEPVANFLAPGLSFDPVLNGLDDTNPSPLDDACFTVCNTDPPIMVVVECLSIGSTVFSDLNNNATLDAGTDMGIAGVTVELVDAAGMVIATDVTDATGDYFFGGLEAGSYTVQVPTTPTGFPTSSTDPAAPADVATDDNMDSGSQPGGTGTIVTSPVIVLVAGAEPLDADETGSAGMQDNGGANPTTTSTDDANGDMTVDFGFAPTFDLALIKTVAPGQSNLFMPGDMVTFTITVTNQGGIAASNIEITDYVPTGLIFDPMETSNMAAGWTTAAGVVSATIPGPVAENGGTATIDIVLEVGPGTDGDMLVNVAEISAATDLNGNVLTDVDSTPDADDTNDAGGAVDTDSDDVIDGDSTGTPGDEVAATDEDDSDPAQIMIGGFDLALIKELGVGQSEMIMPGDNVTFTITVTNQGMVDADNVLITDYVPTGFMFNSTLNPDWVIAGMNATYTLPALLAAGDDTSFDIILTVDGGLTANTQLINIAEITSATDGEGGAVTDVDSTPDAMPGNDAGGLVNSGADNTDSGDGTGTIGDGDPGSDEDDSDPEDVTVLGFDLALTKVVTTPADGMVMPGQDVTYTITVVNQGMVTATDIMIVDYIPAGLVYNTTSDGLGWTLDGATGNANATIAGPLAPNMEATIDIILTVGAGTDGESLVNISEITEASDATGMVATDIDSTPDSNPNNDAGGVPDTGSDDVVGGDSSGMPGDTDPATDEDDADPAQVTVGGFDLALIKELATGQSDMVVPGETVTFTITVTNQGAVDATQILITDYLPATGYTFMAADNPAWTDNGATVETTLPGTLAAGASTTVNIVLTVDLGLMAGTQLINVAEITSALDGEGGDVTDVDSNPDAINGNDAGGLVNSGADDVDSGDGTGTPGDGDPASDEDDSDPEDVTILAFDLALEKELSPGQSDMVRPGDTIAYTITVTNEGEIAADNIEVTDYLDVDGSLSFEAGVAGNADWMLLGGFPTTTLTVADSELPAGGLLPGESVSVEIFLTLDNPLDAGATITNTAEISDATDDNGNPQPDVDSDPDADFDPDEDEDDVDDVPVTIQAFDLALIKMLAPMQDMSVEPGDTIAYTITVINQGDIPADNITVTDYQPTELDFEAMAGNGTDDNTTLGWTLVAGLPTNTLTVADGELPAGGLAPGASVTVDLYLTLTSPLAAGTSLDNFAEISDATDENGDEQDDVDSDFDTDPDDDTLTSDNEVDGDGNNPGEDDDDHDIATITAEAFDLALTKGLSPGQSDEVRPGDTIAYTITVINQGMIAADNIEVTDYLDAPAGNLSFEAGVMGNEDWMLVGANPTTTLTIADGDLPAGGLAPGAMVTVEIFLTLANPLDAGAVITNKAEISMATDENGDPQEDTDSTPDSDNDPDEDEDDVDEVPVTVQTFDVALIKELAAGQDMTVAPGDTVAYTLTVFNQGDIPADNIVITDYVPADMSFEPGAGNGTDDNTSLGWMDVAGNPTNTLMIPGGLAPGSSTTIDIFLTLASPLPAGSDISNFAEISDATDENGDMQMDVDSDLDTDPDDDDLTADNNVDGDGTIPGEDDDDHDVAVITTATFDLALAKELSPGQSDMVRPGDTLAYTITVTNEGDIAADNVEVTDYLPADMTLTFDATLADNADWAVDADGNPATTLTVADGDLPAGGLAPGASASVEIFLKLANPLDAGATITNVAEITAATDDTGDPQEDDDSTPDNEDEDEDDQDDVPVTIQAFDLALIKMLAPMQDMSVEPGDTIAYTITVINQGDIPADNITVTDYQPTELDFEAMAGNGTDDNTTLGWTLVAGLPTNTLTVADGELPAGGLAPGASVTVDLYLTLTSPLAAGTSLDNFAEISDATDENGDEQDDVDSDFDTDPDDDTLTSDNEVDGDGNNPGEDDDDHDIATITAEAFDLALTKGLSPGQSDEVRPGDTIAYTITVINQGMIAADNIEVTDYLDAPAGNLSFEAGVMGNEDWMLVGANPTTTLTIADGDLPAGGLAPGAMVTVEIFLTLANPLDAGAVITNKAEISMATDENGDPQEDTDSTPDSDNDPDEDEDDVDEVPVTVQTFDVALIKELAAGQDMTVAPGDTVAYTLTVFNQGDIPADNIVVTDYLPTDLSFEPGAGDGTDDNTSLGWMDVAGNPTATLSVTDGQLPAGGLAPGTSATIDIYLTLASPLPAGADVSNFAEISAATDENGDDQEDVDSDLDTDPDDDTLNDDNDITGNGNDPGQDDDDHDVATLTTAEFDLALMKDLAPGQDVDVRAGDTIAFRITVINEGDIAADNIEVTDYLPADMVLTYDGGVTGNDDEGWMMVGPNAVRTLTVMGGELPAGGLAPGASAFVDIFLTLANPLPAGSSITNTAEISAATDDTGDPQEDSDSTPDNTPGDDEDDTDDVSVMVQAFDLALIKTLATGQSRTVEPGDTVVYTITVFNQGDVPADNILVTDYLPTELSFEMGAGDGTEDNAGLGWTLVAGNPTVTLTVADGQLPTGGLSPDGSATVDIYLTLASPLLPPGTQIDNFAEIGGATDENGDAQNDVDSAYDTDPDNDDLTGDNEINGNGNVDGQDDDDHDIESIVIEGFDLALTKGLSPGQSADVRPGDTIAYTITVINQGMIAADNILVTDYLPSDGSLSYEGSILGNDDAGWALNAAGPQRTISVANGDLSTGGLAPGETASVEIFITLADPLLAGAMVSNFAEISDATDENGDPQDDIDSTPDDTNDEDVVNDDEVDGNGNQGGDEDDHDVEVVTVQRFDLALTKALSPGQSAQVQPGDTVSFDIIVTNQGDINADNVAVVDFIPSGMMFDAGITGNEVWTAGVGVATTTLSVADGELPVGGLAPGQTATATIMLVLASPQVAGMSLRNVAEIQDATDENGDMQIDDDSDFNVDGEPADEIDDTDDDDVDGDGQNGGDEDESDFEDVEILTFDLALQKMLAAGQSGSVNPGDTVTYDLVIINQGAIAADNITLVDFIPEGMTLDMSFGNFVFDAGTNTATDVFTVADGDLPAGGLAAGASVTFQIQLVLDVPLAGGLTLRNIAELGMATDENGNPQIDDDSTPADPNNPDDIDDNDDNVVDGDGTNGGDEDESDFEEIMTNTFDLALTKTLSPGQSSGVDAGDTVAFTIRVINQGTVAADNIRVSDYAPADMNGFMFDPTLNPDWMEYANIDNTLYLETTLTDFDGAEALEPGAFVDVEIFLTVNPAMIAQMQLTNIAEVSDATDANGNEVIEVDSPMDTIPGNDTFLTDNQVDGNQLEGEDSDNSDPATISVGGFDLALVKTLSSGQGTTVNVGDDVEFDIRVINQGAIPADNIVVVDYVPFGFIFDPALNPDWMLNADNNPVSTLSVAEGDLPVEGLMPGQNVTVQIVLTVAPAMFPDYAMGVTQDAEGVESGQVLVNEAEIVSATDEDGNEVTDIDSTPDDVQGNDGDIVDDNENGGGDTDGDGVIDEDEDDSDIAVVTLECFQDPGVDNTIQVCLGCDEANVTINLFESLGGFPNIGGTFTEGDLLFVDDDGAPVVVDLSDPENVVIPGNLDRSRNFSIDYTIAAVNDCPVMVATITIDVTDIQNLSCTGSQNISLGEDCEAEITADQILLGNVGCANSLTVVLMTATGDTLRDANGLPTATVNNDQINETLFVSLVDPQCNNTCWGQITIEDKQRPTIECPDDASSFNGVDFICTDIDMILNQQSSLAFTGNPVIADNCTPDDELVLEFYDLLLPNADPQCTVQTILRTFVVTDESGNSARCVQEITVRPPTLDDVTIPDTDVVNISCGEDFEALPNGNPVPSLGGEPTITTAFGTNPISGGSAYCNIAAGFEDSERIVTCPNTFKFVRTYRVFDWCEIGSDPITFTQIVKVGDFDAPTFTAPVRLDDQNNPITGPVVYGTNAGNQCAAFIRLDDASIRLVDNCSAGVSLSATIYLNGDLNSAPLGSFAVDLNNNTPELSSELPVGDHVVRYTYTDDCGNVGQTDVDIRIQDLTPPVAICEDGLNISLTGSGGNGFAVITPEMIDRGSYDDCSNITLDIARVNGADQATEIYDNEIIVTCADVGTLRIGLRVRDAAGRENFCWLDVLVEDKLAPACVQPGDLSITCDEYNQSLPADIMDASDETLDALFGIAGGADNCNVDISQTISGDVNSCGVGRLVRTFTVSDGNFTAPTCQQVIRVIGVHDYRITFPRDAAGDCAVIPEYDGIKADELACDLITTTADVDTLRTIDAGDECFKLRVTYDVVNWCEYNTFGEPYIIDRDGGGSVNRNPETQVLYLNVIPENTINTGDDRAFVSRFFDREVNTNNPQNDLIVDTDYASSDSRGFFRYVQFVKIYDEVAPEITFTEMDGCVAGSGEGCTATVEINFTATDACSTPTVDLELDANYVATNGFQPDNAQALGVGITVDVVEATGEYTVTATNVPAGEHALRVIANDGCGNSDVQIIEFCVNADRTPTPICIQTLVVVLADDGNGGGTGAIWASDFIASPIEDCLGNTVGKYSLYRSSTAGGNGFDPIVGNTGIDDISCADVGNLNVRLYAFDDAGSDPDFCEVVVEVQDNSGVCVDSGSTGNLAGLILTEEMETVENAVVELQGPNNMSLTMSTANDGLISFRNVNMETGSDYTLSPTHYTDFINGVRTSDIVAITRHILGENELPSVYKMIAADANGDNGIDVSDIISIRRLILGLALEYPNDVPSWRFIPVDYDFPQANFPWAENFPEVMNFNDLQGSIGNADFVGVKIGDVNGTARANSAARSNPRDFRGDLEMELDEIDMIQGETYTVPVTSAQLTQMDGYQFTLKFDQSAIEIERIESGLVTEANFGWSFVSQGMITTSWNWNGTDTPANWTGDEVLFSLVVRAEANGKLSDALDATNGYTEAEAYERGTGSLRNLTFVFNEERIEVGGYRLLQNIPNPVRKETVIGYELPEAHAEVTISITDAAGRLVREIRQTGTEGYNSVRLTKRNLGGVSGVYSYTVTAGEWVATKRMIIIE